MNNSDLHKRASRFTAMALLASAAVAGCTRESTSPAAPVVASEAPAAAVAAASRSPEPQISVVEQLDGKDGSSAIRISAKRGDESREWIYKDLWLDREVEGAAPYKIVTAGKESLLVVRAYSGGAHCCWSLLAFNLDTLTPLGQLLGSQSSIELDSTPACELRASAVPVDAAGAQAMERGWFCFDGRRFVRQKPA